jgi:UDP-N-acetylglucosamine 1-carboxyvinyltransferase
MTEFIQVQGGKRLKGSVKVSGAKNAALPMLMATLLSGEEIELKNIPNLLDVGLTIRLLEQFGAEVSYFGNTIKVKTPKLEPVEASYSLVKALRASFWVLGPLVARGRTARVALPGGDAIGNRPVDIHLKGLTQMGADVRLVHGVVYAAAPKGLRPADIEFSFPSVGATHQIMMAAALTPGTTVIRNAACEPEIVALGGMLRMMGAEIEGEGTATVVIRGRESLGGGKINIIGDRIEAGTYLLAGIAAGGDVKVEGIDPNFFGSFLPLLREMGAEVETGPDMVRVKREGPILPISTKTEPFPGLATDLQAPLLAALTLAHGESVIEENIFEGRFGHVPELARMGASIDIQDRKAIIKGVPTLSGAPVEATDIRGGAALVVAGLAAEGITKIHEIDHLRRGYDRLEAKLKGLGAEVSCRPEEIEVLVAFGC